jgi:hypothetical protein
MTDDRFEEVVREAAKSYNEPPPAPRDEIWARLSAARRGESAPGPEPEIVELASRRRPARWAVAAAALAAVLLLGVMIGRFTAAPTRTDTPTATAAVADTAGAPRPNGVMRFAAIQHLSQIQALLVDYEAGRLDADFHSAAEDLLFRTRLLLDAEGLEDPSMRTLLRDLELFLAEVAQLARTNESGERELIDQGLDERKIRPRLRNAIPAGPTA